LPSPQMLQFCAAAETREMTKSSVCAFILVGEDWLLSSMWAVFLAQEQKRRFADQ
jgi:hypothetical protein